MSQLIWSRYEILIVLTKLATSLTEPDLSANILQQTDDLPGFHLFCIGWYVDRAFKSLLMPMNIISISLKVFSSV